MHCIEGPDDARLGDLHASTCILATAFALGQDLMLELGGTAPRDTYDVSRERCCAGKAVQVDDDVSDALF